MIPGCSRHCGVISPKLALGLTGFRRSNPAAWDFSGDSRGEETRTDQQEPRPSAIPAGLRRSKMLAAVDQSLPVFLSQIRRRKRIDAIANWLTGPQCARAGLGEMKARRSPPVLFATVDCNLFVPRLLGFFNVATLLLSVESVYSPRYQTSRLRTYDESLNLDWGNGERCLSHLPCEPAQSVLAACVNIALLTERGRFRRPPFLGAFRTPTNS